MLFLAPISTKPIISHLHCKEIIYTELYPYWTKNAETTGEILLTPLSKVRRSQHRLWNSSAERHHV